MRNNNIEIIDNLFTTMQMQDQIQRISKEYGEIVELKAFESWFGHSDAPKGFALACTLTTKGKFKGKIDEYRWSVDFKGNCTSL